MVSTVASTRPRLPRKKHLQTVSDGRHAALAVVLLLEQGAQVQAALDGYLRGASLKAQDKALCTELVYGYLRAEIRIEHLLHGLLRNPKKLPREMYLALGLALYALLFLERIPPHATVDWTVGHVRHRFGEPMSRVANGALRSFIRLGDSPKHISHYYPQGQYSDSALDAVALQATALFYSLPLWVVQLWNKAYGPAACTALCQRSLRAPYAGVRVNAQSRHAVELHAALVSCLAKAESAIDTGADSTAQTATLPTTMAGPGFSQPASGHVVGFGGVAFAAGRSPHSVANAPLSYWQQQGVLSFQSAGSQCVMQALEPRTWSAPVWDMCAGQGGKSAILIEQGLVVALCTDVHAQRLESFTGNMQRLASTFAHGFQPELQGANQSMVYEQSGLCSGAQSPCPSLPAEAFYPCVLPDTALSLGAREQAVALLDAVSAAHGSPAIAVPYPPQQGKKRWQSHKADDDYDEAYAAAVDCDDQHLDAYAVEQTLAADSSCTFDDCAGQGSVGFKDGAGQGHVPAYLPLVALMDGCLAPANSWAGTICIDAPCSGLGILHRRPDIRRHRRPDSMDELLALQADLLDAAWKALKVGGGLVYMTCTLNPAENEEQIQRLLRNYPEARLVRQWQTDHHHPWLEGMFGAYCVKDSSLR